ncbi:protein kinase domain-containing protein [Pengzhenrongella phosphoraccumulans]|uniref:protein kinase domain-containing protein n=1 Tax=Pengzhenrongella phosphoraccumulans TaxID=3114394 RepID=UPI00388F85CC
MTLVGGRYALGRLLGSGGSAAVFEAEDVRLGRLVAVKVLHAHLAARPGAGAELLADAQTAAALDHPHLVRVLDAGVEGTDEATLAWIVLELVDGVTLGTLVDRVGPLTARDALGVVAGVLAGLGHAHEHGVLHLDVSPANVMVPFSPHGFDLARACLLDLGSRPRPALRDRLVRVSPHYASPELATAAPADARADLYAVGAVLFFLLTGRPPFERDDLRAVLEAQVLAPPPMPSSLVPTLSSEVDLVVATALAKDPADRYGSARAMGVAVARAAAALAARDGTAVGRTKELAGVRAPAAPVLRALPALRAVPEQQGLPEQPGLPAQQGPPARRLGLPLPAEQPTGGAGLAVALTSVLVVVGIAVGAVALGSSGAESAGAVPAAAARPAMSSSSPPTARAAQAPVALAPVALAPVTAPPTTVPVLAGLTLAGSDGVLTAAGLLAGAVTRADSPLAAGTVLESTPAAGETVAVGGTVALVVASGITTVPDVVGLGSGPARGTLEAAGFVVVAHEVAVGPSGTAIRTEPGAGARGLVGGVVVLEVARAVVPPTASPSAPPASPAPTPDPVPPA